VISREIGNGPNLQGFGPFGFWCWSWGSAGGLVVAGGVEGEGAEDLAAGGVDDADVEVGDEEDRGLTGVDPADADVVKVSVVSQ
jgi:hypothetical protein